MPSEIAHTIVNHVFGDEKAKAIDAMNDALSASAYDAIQQQKVEFAKMHGFNTTNKLLICNSLLVLKKDLKKTKNNKLTATV